MSDEVRDLEWLESRKLLPIEYDEFMPVMVAWKDVLEHLRYLEEQQKEKLDTLYGSVACRNGMCVRCFKAFHEEFKKVFEE